MSFADLYGEVARLRFTGQTVGPKAWVQKREAVVWAIADWPWKKVAPALVVLTPNADSISAGAMPAALRHTTALFDDLGDPLEYIDEERFWIAHLGNTNKARPSLYTIINGLIYLDPTPDQAYNFKITGRRILSHLTGIGAVAVGPMSLDSDTPIFPSDHHYGLVHGALAEGKKSENDPSWRDDEQEFQDTLNLMIAEHLPDRPLGAPIRWGRDPL